MKTTNKLARILAATLIVITVIVVSCKKETSKDSSEDETTFATVSSTSSIQSESAFGDVFNNVIGVSDEFAFGGTGVFARVISTDSASPCFTVQVTRLNAPAQFPAKVVIDFGTGCKGRDSIIRKGKIITIYSGRLAEVGKIAETTFDGYYMNNIHIEGFHRIENVSTSQALSFKVNVTDGKLTMTNGNYTQRTGVYTITQTEGYATPFWLKDDVFSIQSEASGTAKTDSLFFKWNSKTVDPLIKKFTCPWIVKGKIGIGKTSADAAFIDYGDGTCDNKATLIINNSTIEISLL